MGKTFFRKGGFKKAFGKGLLQGIADLKFRIKLLRTRGAQLSKAGLMPVMTELAKRMRRTAPRGPTGLTKKSIGKRFKKLRRSETKQVIAKVGVNVAKNPDAQPDAKHVPLTGAGSKPRYRKSGGYAGRMPKNRWIRRCVGSALGTIKTLWVTAVKGALDVLIFRTRKRRRK